MDEHATSRLSWEDAHRLEVTLRARANAMTRRDHAVGRCPGCGRPVGEDEDQMRVGGLIVHPSCLFVCRGDQISSSSAARNRSFSSRVP
jgi:hypothetical protein